MKGLWAVVSQKERKHCAEAQGLPLMLSLPCWPTSPAGLNRKGRCAQHWPLCPATSTWQRAGSPEPYPFLGLEMTPRPLITSFPAGISLSCLISQWLCVSPLPYLSVCTAEKQLQRWKHCSQMLLTEQGEEKRAAEHLPRQKQLKADFKLKSKFHSEKYARKCHFNLLEMSPISMGVWHFWNSAFYNFFFHLELCFHSYPCNCSFGQICSFWRTHWSLATIESWDVGPSSSSLGQESGKREAIFPDAEFSVSCVVMKWFHQSAWLPIN